MNVACSHLLVLSPRWHAFWIYVISAVLENMFADLAMFIFIRYSLHSRFFHVLINVLLMSHIYIDHLRALACINLSWVAQLVRLGVPWSDGINLVSAIRGVLDRTRLRRQRYYAMMESWNHGWKLVLRIWEVQELLDQTYQLWPSLLKTVQYPGITESRSWHLTYKLVFFYFTSENAPMYLDINHRDWITSLPAKSESHSFYRQ